MRRLGILCLFFLSTSSVFAGMTSSGIFDGNYGVEVAAFATTSTGAPSGSLVVSGVPAGASIVSAALYAHNWAAATPTATFAGSPLGSTSAFAVDPSPWRLEAYRWDISSLVTGNGSYNASAAGLSNSYGLAMVVVFAGPGLPHRRIVLNDGSLQLSGDTYFPDTETTTFAGFDSGPGRLWIYTEADNLLGQTDEQILFNGAVVGGPIDNNLGPNASLFSLPVTTVAGTNTAAIFSPGDHFGWHLAVLEGGPRCVVPAPGAALLVAMGVGVVGWLRRRKAL